jgi:signal transduction histidine kinase
MAMSGSEEWVLNLARALQGRNRPHVRQVTAAARAAGLPEPIIKALIDLARPATVPQPVATPLRRFARGLQIPLFEESKGKIAPLTSAAEQKLGVGFPGSAEDAIAQLTGHRGDDPAIASCLEKARKEGEASLTLSRGGDDWQLHATMAVSGLQIAVVSKASSGAAELDVLATINHEMANGLTAMASLAAHALRSGADGSDRTEALRRIEQAASETLRSVQSTRRALRRRLQSESPSASDLGPLLKDLVDSFAAVASRRRVAVESQIGDRLIAAAPPGDLRSILWNLMKNAIEAVGDGGHVRVEAEAKEHRLRICVADDGPGMDEKTRQRIFDPYFTTKSEGSGLGLPLVKHLTQRLGGKLELHSETGRGTRFVVWLPRIQPVSLSGPPGVPSDMPRVSGMRPTALTKRACLVGRAAEALETMLRDNKVELEALATVLAEGAPIDWAFMDPDAASFASAVRPHASQVVWVGDLPDDAEDTDAVFEGSVDGDALTRWLLAHTQEPVVQESAGEGAAD